MAHWHSLPAEEVLQKLGTRREGLTREEVENRLRKYGYNEIEERKRNPLLAFLRQFNNFLVYILLVATIFSLALGEVIDAVTIIAIVLLMAVTGFLQEYKAEKAIEALKKMLSPIAKVIREGKVIVIPSREVVPGDIIVLEEGDRVPADARLIEAEDLELDESSLTGESVPVEKEADTLLPQRIPVSDRKNMVFMQTFVVRGKGKAVVVATGMNTVVGKIAASLGEIREEKTLLEKELDRFGRRIGVVFLLISALVFVLEFFLRKDIVSALLVAVALAVAAVPEGLPAIATTILAIGAYRMAKRNAIVRRLSSIETLGACTVICSDKTGTITKGEMTIKKISFVDGEVEITGIGLEPEGEFIYNGRAIKPLEQSGPLRLILLASALNSDAEVYREGNEWKIRGSPTEAALTILARKAGIDKNILSQYSRVKTIQFDRFRKRKTTIHKHGGRYIIFTIGAPEIILTKCSTEIYSTNGVRNLSQNDIEKIQSIIFEYASKGLRTLGFAYKIVEDEDILEKDWKEVEKELIFLGVAGMIDPPREGVKEAVDKARKAGIKVIMVTGDHKVTAMAIAREIGLQVSEDNAIEGSELDEMSDEELSKVVDKITVYARVTPEHKARIVKHLKEKGHVVAMTGDGVNDAIALKMADIGVAMGIRGTDVAKEASDLVLADDNFSTIVKAVEEGRVIFENIKKPIDYLLSCNFGEVFTVASADMLGLPRILNPAQILWINLVTDALPALALGLEPPEPGIMDQSPRSREEHLINWRRIGVYTFIGMVIAIAVISAFILHISRGVAIASSLAFTLFVFMELLRAFSSKSENKSLLEVGFTSNKVLLISILASLALHLILIYSPLRAFFKVELLSPEDIAWLLLLSPVPLIASEIRKKIIKL